MRRHRTSLLMNGQKIEVEVVKAAGGRRELTVMARSIGISVSVVPTGSNNDEWQVNVGANVLSSGGSGGAMWSKENEDKALQFGLDDAHEQLTALSAGLSRAVAFCGEVEEEP